VGRRSGKVFETPVVLARVPEGFIAELTYGDQVNWYRNIVAAGTCVVVHQGRDHEVVSIEKCEKEEGLAAFPPARRAILRVTGRRDFRLLWTADRSAHESAGS
jgi:hypothetical protein